MAQKQKLAAEIDRTVRKVTEGISLFDDIWEKLHNANAPNLKERLQADLKSETKKLQRMREQIKTWQGMSDIRDKRQIDEARRNIEAKMEQFKACEREAKIKTFSKIGLSLPAKEDPEEMAKEANRQWMNSAIDNLQQQREQCEADIEGGTSRRAKRGKSRGGDVEAGKERIMQYRFHIAKLEQLLRMLDNDQVSAQDVEALQEPITHFVDCNQDSSYDSIELEGIYLDVIPEDMDDPDTPSQPHIDKKEEPLTKKEVKEREREKRKAGKKEAAEQAEKASTPTTPSMVTPPAAPLTKTNSRDSAKQAAAASTLPSSAKGAKAAATASAGSSASGSAGSSPTVAAPGPKKAQASQQPAPLSSNSTARQPAQAATGVSPVRAAASPTVAPGGNTSSSPTMKTRQTALKTAAAAPSAAAPASPIQPIAASPPTSEPGTPSSPSIGADEARPVNVLKMLEQSCNNLPVPEDTRKRQPYVPPNPYKTPNYYPQQPHAIFEQPGTFSRFETDALFFIFYYQQNSYQQFLAAKELKRQMWRFHKKFLKWFQRADPPSLVSDDYEQGAYIYFEYEEGWTTRVQSDFTFRYVDLEDEGL